MKQKNEKKVPQPLPKVIIAPMGAVPKIMETVYPDLTWYKSLPENETRSKENIAVILSL